MWDEPIAIVGLGGILPGAPDLEAFWRVVSEGRDCASEPPPGRWVLPVDEAYDARRQVPDRVSSRRGCYLRDFEFDAGGIDLDSDLLQAVDPMIHLALHAGRQAWSQARTTLVDPARVGVVLGNIVLPTHSASAMSEWMLGRRFERELFRSAGVALPPEGRAPVAAINRWVAGMPAGLLARGLGLGGGHFTLDAACASSLFALGLAIDALRSGRADAMLTGGLARPDALYTQMGFSQLRAVSATGRCSPFDHKGDGLVVGEGAGILVVKRLSDALAHGDDIRALVRGVGLSNDVDGNLLAPSKEGQLRAMRAAYATAGWRPDEVEHVECHATGTPVGDAVEFRSLRSLWEGLSPKPSAAGGCVLGATKANVGHLLTGAGAVGLIKTVLAMEHETLPPMANFERAGEGIDLEASPFSILREARPWESPTGRGRRAAVSGFGFGGTNAHVLLEAPTQLEQRADVHVDVPAQVKPADEPIAVVGMAGHVGPWADLGEIRARLFGQGPAHAPSQAHTAFGIEVPGGYFIDRLTLPLGEFRIPPKEIERALPQQILMLQVAGRALADVRSPIADPLRAGVFVGVELDLGTTNHQLRWNLRARAEAWARALEVPTSGAAFEAWVDALCESIAPALDADRTMGGLASITASRIAREFGLGGPSYTLSSEETSGCHALEVAVSALRGGSLDAALVGAVDLSGDVRALLATLDETGIETRGRTRAFEAGSEGIVPTDAAVSLVLKRLGDAQRDGDRVYAVLGGIGSASGSPRSKTALTRSYKDASREHEGRAQLYLAHGAGVRSQDILEAEFVAGLGHERDAQPPLLASAASLFGQAGAASGLLSVLSACLCTHHQILPAFDPGAPLATSSGDAPERLERPEPWLRDRIDGPRCAMVAARSISGATTHVMVQDVECTSTGSEWAQPLGPPPEALFVVEGDSTNDILAGLRRLAQVNSDVAQRREAAASLDHLARGWFHERGQHPEASMGLALIARDHEDLARSLDRAIHSMEQGEDPALNGAGRLFFARNPLLADRGELAFTYPGSGSQFPGMGRDLGLCWPEVLRRQDGENDRLRSQILPSFAWRADAETLGSDARRVILAQVALGTVGSEVMLAHGVRPSAVIGYSLGETAGLFSLGAWRTRDLMFQRALETPLFTRDLAGPCQAVRTTWGLGEDEQVDWSFGVVDRPAKEVREAAKAFDRAYLLISNTPDECVVGGDAGQVRALVGELGTTMHELRGITTVHCEVAKPVADAYRSLHLLETDAPADVRFYSGAWGRSYEVNRESAADAILAQALDGVDYPKTILRAYEDGVRVFLEMGPGASCSRMISKILGDRPHVARSISTPSAEGHGPVVRALATLVAHRGAVDLGHLYPEREHARDRKSRGSAATMTVEVARNEFGSMPELPRAPAPTPAPSTAASVATRPVSRWKASADASPGTTETPMSAAPPRSGGGSGAGAGLALQAAERTAQAHETFLRISTQVQGLAAEQVVHQMQLLAALGDAPLPASSHELAEHYAPPAHALRNPPNTPPTSLDREACMEFAIGSVGRVLGERYAAADGFPTRVRLPDEPLMLVDRITAIEAEPLSMSSGRVVTEHDVLHDGWYLDGGRIPTCVAVEAGQADLFLSGYLGIDLETRGLSMYRLLDAEVTFLDELPGPGEVIVYDIRIKHFFRQGETWLFRFEFDATVNGRPLMTMRDGCAGFFSQAELDAGQGIVHSRLEREAAAEVRPEAFTPPCPLRKESFSSEQLEALRAGDLGLAFGEAFARLGVSAPLTIPGGLMRLVQRIVGLDPVGGKYGAGTIVGEAEIHPDDWFLICHFSDDQVMPGTLMYECCLHTLRVFLLRMGWVAPSADACWLPVVGVHSILKCRGQVLATTKKVTYEISLKEMGYGPEPYAICDALMYADGKPIVEIRSMSTRLVGTDREQIDRLWATAESGAPAARVDGPLALPAIYDKASIMAYSNGRPSEAFGAPYRIFDEGERRLARLPGPPYQFQDRVTKVSGEPFKLKAGATVEAQYDLRADDWFFQSNRQRDIPFSVLLEIALQPCGWLAAYVGSALASDVDLKFRNLGGQGVLHQPVDARDEVLTVRVSLDKVSHSGGMIIQHFTFCVLAEGRGEVYTGTTYFGFFSKAALAEQKGIQGHPPVDVSASPKTAAERLPEAAPFPEPKFRMIDRIDRLTLKGGPHGLGEVEGSIDVDPEAWFFKAHFYQDPVWPGSLGLEAHLQLLKAYAAKRWELGPQTRFLTMPLGHRHEWIYRGQIIPNCTRVDVQASISAVDDANKRVVANGLLRADGLAIYELRDFALEVQS